MKAKTQEEVDVDEFSMLISQNESPDEIMRLLGINKTCLNNLSKSVSMKFDPEFSRWVRRFDHQGYFRWCHLESEVDKLYRFPDAPSTHMCKFLEISTIYRWIVQDNDTNRIECMYIGQTSNFLNRLKSYLYKDQRIGNCLHSYASNPSFSVMIQTIAMSKRSLFDETFVPLIDINCQSDRSFFEYKAISYYESQGYKLLNIQRGMHF
jgi:hypothetical protein